MDDNGRQESMLEMFIYEANQLLDQLEEIMLETEKNGGLSTENINEIFRIMHTIKGSSAMMMYDNISKLAHSVEDLFYYFRQNPSGEIDISAVCDLVLSASDFIKQEIMKLEDGGEPDGDETEVAERIKAYLGALNQEADVPAVTNALSRRKSEKPAVAKPAPEKPVNVFRYIAHVSFEEGGQMENLRAFTIVRNLLELTSELYTYPADLINCPPETILEQGFTLYFATASDESKIKALLEEALFLKSYELRRVDSYADELRHYGLIESAGLQTTGPQTGQSEQEVVKISGTQIRPAAPRQKKGEEPVQSKSFNQAGKEPSKGGKLSMISVNVEKLDALLNLVGELVITESMVTKSPDLAGLQLENFSKASRQLRKLTDELQDVVMSIRMVQIAGTFQKMQRIVRDMSRKLNRDVEFVTVGDDTEVDKNIIDHLSDPLMHLIRNSMDHGVEPEEERIAKGKAPKARITLAAQNTGGDVIITVSDDGRGLDKAKILKKAREKGLLTKPEKDMTEKEIFSLIMIPGFSTNDEVTEYSGRGVGMDVVKSNLEEIGGSISIKSIEGEGTTTTIVIPLTLAIADAMELSVGNCIYTLPTVSIKEAFRPQEDEIIYDQDNEMIMIRGSVYPIIRLHKLFHIETEITKLSEGILILVEGENKAACIFADQLIGEQQIVVKPLPQYLLKYKLKETGIEGCTILGDGSISLILNAKGLINRII